MKINVSLRFFLLLFLLVIVPFASAIAAGDTRTLIGSKVINFSLPSTQDRLITYGNEFYGRQNLIITFFPAAFTPV